MNTNKRLIAILTVAALVAWFLSRQTQGPTATEGLSAETVQPVSSDGASFPDPHPAFTLTGDSISLLESSASGLGPNRIWTSNTPAQTQVRLRGDEVLATVNGMPITLKDLMPLDPGAAGMERTLPQDRYDMLLNRAVERELAFQSAKANGVGLSEPQLLNLARRRSQNSPSEPGEFDSLGRTAVNTEFEQRDAEGLMLLHNLASAAGMPPADVTTELVQDYFIVHRNEFPAIPEDPARMQQVADAIDAAIRAQLSAAVKARYAESFHTFVQRLKAAARIAFTQSM